MTRWLERGIVASAAFTVPLTLRFERAGEISIDVEVRAATDGNGSGAQH